MSLSILAAALLATAPAPDSRGDRAFEAAKRRELHERAPELVLLVEAPNSQSWETVTVYRLDASPVGRSGEAWRWVVRRDRWGDLPKDDSDEGDAFDVIGARVLTTWADSNVCAGVVPLLEAVERFPPIPYDLRGVGSDYDLDEIVVGVARTRFWLNWGPATPGVQTQGDLTPLRWWGGDDALRSCWTSHAPVAG